MIFALLTLLAALALASVAGWFSIVGFMAIYAGAPMYALIMGVVTEVAKLVTTSWLYRNWSYADWKLKGPLLYFTLALMTATSIGVFGFLSKAHLEQGAGTIDNSAKITQLQYQIDREKSSIADNEKVTKQLDDTVNSLLGKDRADRALSVRKSQATQRKQLRDDSTEAQKRIDALSKEKFDLESEVRKMELDVGPIRYIAELFYGVEENATKNIEAAVRIFTLLLVSTLDPLAVVLLVAANHTLIRLRNEKKGNQTTPPVDEKPDGGWIVAIKSKIGKSNIPDVSSASVRENNENSSSTIQEAEVHDSVSSETMGSIDEKEEIFVQTPIQEEVRPDIPAPPIGDEISTEEKGSVDNTQSISEVGSHEETLPPTEVLVNEEENSILEEIRQSLEEKAKSRNTIYAHNILSPAPSRIIEEPSPTEADMPIETSIPETIPAERLTPYMVQTPLLRELIGNEPHFEPKKLNEEEDKKFKETKAIPERRNIEQTIQTGAPPSSKIISGLTSPKTEEISVEGSKNQEADRKIPTSVKGVIQPEVDKSEVLEEVGNKYPKALSWITEFRRK